MAETTTQQPPYEIWSNKVSIRIEVRGQSITLSREDARSLLASLSQVLNRYNTGKDTEEEVRRLYLEERLPLPQIAAQLSRHPSYIAAIVARLGIANRRPDLQAERKGKAVPRPRAGDKAKPKMKVVE